MQSFLNAAHDNEVMISLRSGVSRSAATVLCNIKSGYYIWLFFKSMLAEEELKKDGIKNHRCRSKGRMSCPPPRRSLLSLEVKLIT